MPDLGRASVVCSPVNKMTLSIEYIFEIRSDVTSETVSAIADYFTHLRQKLNP